MLETGFVILAIIVMLLVVIKGGVRKGKQGIRDIGEVGLYVLLGFLILMVLVVIGIFPLYLNLAFTILAILMMMKS